MRSISVLAVFFLAFTVELSAQTAVLYGRVVHDNKPSEGVPGVDVLIEGRDPISTNLRGDYKVADLQIGRKITVVFDAPLYSPRRHSVLVELTGSSVECNHHVLLRTAENSPNYYDGAAKQFLARAQSHGKLEEIWLSALYRDLPAHSKAQLAKAALQLHPSLIGKSSVVNGYGRADAKKLSQFEEFVKAAFTSDADFPTKPTAEKLNISDPVAYDIITSQAMVDFVERQKALGKFQTTWGTLPVQTVADCIKVAEKQDAMMMKADVVK
ncbi:MAG: hypothetical protein FJW20_25445 [Acidimicrobiia bacterium]|nr:hypothetical protein [Acidimicrobiia bacterium]